jgi:hypothetical protein
MNTPQATEISSPLALPLLPAPGEAAVQDDRQGHQHDASGKKGNVAHRSGAVVHDDADDQRKSDPDRKRHRHAGYLDRGDQQNVREIEDRTANQRR